MMEQRESFQQMVLEQLATFFPLSEKRIST